MAGQGGIKRARFGTYYIGRLIQIIRDFNKPPELRESKTLRDYEKSNIPEKDLSDRFCGKPFRHMEIMHGGGKEQTDEIGDVYLCCPGWLSTPIGRVSEQSFKKVWNSENAIKIRQSILDGTFKYCNQQACPHIQGNKLPKRTAKHNLLSARVKEKPKDFFLCYDRTCNLVCPSCRSVKMSYTSGPGADEPMKINKKLLKYMFSKPTDDEITLMITGSGDPFVSVVFQDLMTSINGRDFPNLKIHLYTNGLLFTEHHWSKLKHLHGNIELVSISMDAATEETYKVVRGGSWKLLKSNLAFIQSLREEQGFKFRFEANYVVQKANYFEVGEFVRFCKPYGIGALHYSLVSDWKSWSKEEYKEQCVWAFDHPEHSKFLDALDDPILSDEISCLGPLTQFYRDVRPPARDHLNYYPSL